MTIGTFLGAIKNGCDWGPKPFKVRFNTEDGRFWLLSRAGHSGWMRVGNQGYYPAKHSLIDLQKASDDQRGYSLWRLVCVKEWKGRFISENRLEMMNLIK